MFIIFDTEYTSWKGTNENGYNRNTQFPELVQIGALKIDKKFNIIDKLNIFVLPVLNPTLSEYFINLTKITQSKLDKDGIPFTSALNQFYDFCLNDNKLLDIYSYGNDYHIIKEGLDIHNINDEEKFRKWKSYFYDVRNIFNEFDINTDKYSSGTIYTAFNLNPNDISVHDALFDSYSIYMSLRHIYLNINI